MNKYTKLELDNFDTDLLTCHERKQYLKLREQMSKRASLLWLVDNYEDLNFNLQLIADVIKENERCEDF